MGKQSNNEITIKHIKVKDLPSFAAEMIEKAAAGGKVPMTKQRALALSKNPYADAEDVGLLVAYKDGEWVGYFGVMPVLLQHEGKLSKFGWYTTWFVDPSVRGSGVASMLLKETLTLGLDCIHTGAIGARGLSRKFDTVAAGPLVYASIDFGVAGRLNPVTVMLRLARRIAHIFGRKLDIHEVSNKVEAVFERLFAWLLKPWLYGWARRVVRVDLGEVRFEQVDAVREPEAPPKLDEERVAIYRGVEAVNWMLRYPWVMEKGHSETEHLDYYFVDTSERYAFFPLEVFDAERGEYQGYVVLSLIGVKGRLNLRVLDIDLPERYQQYILPLALDYGRKHGADFIHIAKELAKPLEDTLVGRLLLETKERWYIVHFHAEDSLLRRYWKTMELQYCDGDNAFT